jgi:polyhydroxyalkanoate synthesis regulator protein
MYTIKKYANGRFYDTETKNYVTRPQIVGLQKAGKEISIIDTKTGKTITSDIMSQIEAKEKKTPRKTVKKKRSTKAAPTSGLVQLIRKSGDTLFDYGKKYASMWQNMVTMSKEEIDKLVNMLVKDNKLSEFEADKFKKEVQRYRDSIEKWFSRNIDKRVNEALSRMNLANRDQIVRLTNQIDTLNKKIKQLEKSGVRGAKTRKGQTLAA